MAVLISACPQYRVRVSIRVLVSVGQGLAFDLGWAIRLELVHIAGHLVHVLFRTCYAVPKSELSLSHVTKAVVFNLFAGAEPQENLPVTPGTPVQ